MAGLSTDLLLTKYWARGLAAGPRMASKRWLLGTRHLGARRSTSAWSKDFFKKKALGCHFHADERRQTAVGEPLPI